MTKKSDKKHADLSDRITVIQAIREFGFAKPTLYKWAKLGNVFLGRRLHHELRTFGRRQVLYVSRADLQQLKELLQDPIGKEIHGNDGIWISSVRDMPGTGGVYKDSEGLWHSLASIEADLSPSIDHKLMAYYLEHGHPALGPNSKKVSLGRRRWNAPRVKEAVWASRTIPHGGKVLVVHQQDVRCICEWRDACVQSGDELAAFGGSWLEADVWQSQNGEGFVTEKWIGNKHGYTIFVKHRDKLKQIRIGPIPRLGAGGAATEAIQPDRTGGRAGVFVYPLAKIKKILDAGSLNENKSKRAASDSGKEPQEAVKEIANPKSRRTRAKRAAAKHDKWFRWWKKMKSYADIATKETAEGSPTTKDAVKKAIQRMRQSRP